MTDPPLVTSSQSLELRLFAAHVLHRVTLYELKEIGLEQAVDELRFTAYRHGLTARYGEAEIEWIIGKAFADAGVDYGDIRWTTHSSPFRN